MIRALLIPRGRAGSFRLVMNYFSFALFASLFAVTSCRQKYDIVYAPSPITGLAWVGSTVLPGVPVMLWIRFWPESVSATGAVRSAWLLTD